MPRNGSGTYTIPEAAFVFDTVISETAVNSNFSDIAAAITGSISADGQTPVSANLPMAGYRHTGVGNGSARTDYAAVGQVQDGKLNWVDGGGTADAITATYSPAITALVDGQLCFVRATAANATTTPTFAPNGLTARTIVKNGGSALVAGDIVGDGHELILRYDLSNTRWELLNPRGVVLTTRGDILYYGASGLARLGAGTSGQVLQTGGAGADPSWATMASGAETITAGEDLADRDLIYQDVFNQRGNGATRWYKVDTDATGPVKISPRLGMALAAITSGNTGSAQVRPGRVSGLSGLTAGQVAWASSTAGALTQTEPAIPADGTQVAVRAVGVAASTTELDFDPDDDTVFVKFGDNKAVDATIVVEHWTDSGARERKARAYITTAPGYARITGGTPTAPLGGTAADFNDDSTGTDLNTSTLGNLTAAGVTSRIIAKIDYGSNKTVTKIQAVGWSVSAGSTTTCGLYYSTDDSTYTKLGADISVNTTPATTERTGSVTARYIAAVQSADDWSGVSAALQDLNGYEDSATRNEPVKPGSATIDSAATDCVTVKFADASDANQNTFTTFTNRTNATRDLIVEVTL